MLKRTGFMLIASLFLTIALSESSNAQNCTFTTSGKTQTLNADCTTTSSIIIPNGFTLDGAGHTITAMDPSGGHFTGGVIQNGGATASVTNVKITTSGLAEVCDAGADRLRGILFEGASGSITGNEVNNINQNQGPVLSGCQEGNAIEVRNFGSSATTIRVRIDGNTISGYQKTGIVANGNTDATVTDNVVTGYGPQGYIAQNGIQIGFGATAAVKHNQVSGNAYTGSSTVSGGIIVVAGPGYGSAYSVGDQIMNNTLSGNDIGVWLTQFDSDGNAPATATNAKVVGNIINNNALTNALPYQAGVADQGNNDKIISNTISGAGYDSGNPCGCTFAIDADSSFTNRPKVHANR
jgi:hypothetical protein